MSSSEVEQRTNGPEVPGTEITSTLENELITVSKKQYQEAMEIVKLYRLQQKQRPKRIRSEKQLEVLRMGRRKNPKLAKLYKEENNTQED